MTNAICHPIYHLWVRALEL